MLVVASAANPRSRAASFRYARPCFGVGLEKPIRSYTMSRSWVSLGSRSPEWLTSRLRLNGTSDPRVGRPQPLQRASAEAVHARYGRTLPLGSASPPSRSAGATLWAIRRCDEQLQEIPPAPPDGLPRLRVPLARPAPDNLPARSGFLGAPWLAFAGRYLSRGHAANRAVWRRSRNRAYPPRGPAHPRRRAHTRSRAQRDRRATRRQPIPSALTRVPPQKPPTFPRPRR